MTQRQTDLASLGRSEYDLVVIGGGIFGACAAWDATLRGLKVALVEKSDFCAGVSANSYKIVHGGIRYIQHLDIARVRSSCRERSALLRIAPHLVRPLPTLIPTYRGLLEGKPLLGAGMYLYDLATLDRNAGIADPARRIPWSSFLSRSSVLEQFPDLPGDGLTGAALFCDAQMYNPPRLVWSFLESAIGAGAHAVNWCRAEKLLVERGRAAGCIVRDMLTGEAITVKARAVLNAAGPWAEAIFAADLGRNGRRGVYSRDACFVVRRRFPGPYAIALRGESTDADALLARGGRHLFVVPWRDCTLIGVWHLVTDRAADEVTVTEPELETFIAEINRAYPALQLRRDEVLRWHAGLVPFGEQQAGAGTLSFGKRSLIIDHETEDGVAGLVSLIGIRYTMGRGDAQRAVELVCRKLGFRTRQPATHRIPIAGGDFASFEALAAEAASAAGPATDERIARALVHNHGTQFGRVLRVARERGIGIAPLGPLTTVTEAELRYVTNYEKVETLADAVLRRTDLGTAGHPGQDTLRHAAEIVGDVLGWDSGRISEEVAQVEEQCAPGARPEARRATA